MKYEYKHHTIVFTDPDHVAELNALGAQGWRIAIAEPYESDRRNYTGALLMREVADQPAATETACSCICDGACGCPCHDDEPGIDERRKAKVARSQQSDD